MSHPSRTIGWSAALLFLSLATGASAQSAENVAVVINDNSSDSQRIGEYYARTRALPASNVIRIRASSDETIDRAGYASTIEAPIAAAIKRAGTSVPPPAGNGTTIRTGRDGHVCASADQTPSNEDSITITIDNFFIETPNQGIRRTNAQSSIAAAPGGGIKRSPASAFVDTSSFERGSNQWAIKSARDLRNLMKPPTGRYTTADV